MRLAGKTAIVTGAGGGFGEGIAMLYAQQGAQVLCADLDGAAAERVAHAIGGVPHQGDVSLGADVQAMVGHAVEAFGGIDIIVNNAGTTHRNGPVLDVDEAMFDRVYAVNVKSIYWMVQAAVPVLRRQKRGGSIVNVSSTAGLRPRPGLVWYNGTKGAVNTLTQCLAAELAPDDIRVNAVCPVMGATGLIERVHGRARYARKSHQVPRHHPARAVEHAGRHCQRLPMAGRGQQPFHHRRAAAGGRRSVRVTTVLSIQSWVAYGHVGNAAALFPLQRLGIEAWAVHTVQFSNHPGYGAWTGQVFPGQAVRDLVDGIAARGVLGQCDAVLSGYMGDADTGDAILETAARVRAANPAALYCCDPVMGDIGPGIYVRPGIPELIAGRAVPAADILTPNQFELQHLCGPIRTLAEAVTAASLLRGRMRPGGPAVVLVTSLRTDDTPRDAIDMLACDAAGAVRLRTPLLPIVPSGAGDATAALFLAAWLRTGHAGRALGFAGSAIHAVLRQTAAAGSRELCLVAAQHELVAPSIEFFAEPC